jgi:hypothetical protein
VTQRVRSLALNFVTVAASTVLTLLAIEIALRFLPVAHSPPVEPPTAENPIQRYAANTPYTWSLGWNFYEVVRGRTNAQGFLADYDYDAAAKAPLVAVVGDSYMEALRVRFAETLTGRVQAMLGTQGRAYAFAQSGAPLSQYVAYAQHACATYRPQRLVVNVVGNDFDESVFAHRQRNGLFNLYPQPDGSFDYKLTPLPPPGLVQRVLRQSALALYLARNVGVSGATDWFRPSQARADTNWTGRFVGHTAAAADAARIDEGERVIAWALAALPKAACLPARDIVIVVDAMRPEIYDDNALAEARTSYFGRMRAKLIADARTAGFNVVDMEGPFRANFAKEGRHFEFPNDGHWNSHGHAVAAAAVREALRDWPPLTNAQAHAGPD